MRLAIMTSLGILSCITAASWASLSDRIGRKLVLAVASVGVLFRYVRVHTSFALAMHIDIHLYG